jgi:hypothetical protein
MMAMENYKITADDIDSGLYNITTTGGGSSVSYTDGCGNYWYYPSDFHFKEVDWNKYEQPAYPRDYGNNDLELAEIKEELNKLKEKFQKKEIPMKNFYNVIVVSIDEKVLLDVKVVAADENEAQYLAKVYQTLEKENLKPKDVTIIVKSLGQVKIRPEKKRVIVEKE